MKRMLGIVTALAICVTALAGAQQRRGQRGPLFRAPVFVLQPGFIKSFSEGADFHFNARFVTAIPTSISRTTLVAIIQWTPFNDPDGDDAQSNKPAIVYGPVVNVVNEDMFSFDVDALFAYGPNPKQTIDQQGDVTGSDYSHQFLIEGDFFFKLGRAMNQRGHWRNLNAYAMLAYVLTGQPDAAESKDKTVLLIGLSLPLAPWQQ